MKSTGTFLTSAHRSHLPMPPRTGEGETGRRGSLDRFLIVFHCSIIAHTGRREQAKTKQTSPCHTGRRAKMQSYAKARSPCYTGRREQAKKKTNITLSHRAARKDAKLCKSKITLLHRAARKEKSPCHTGRRGKKNHPVTPGGAERKITLSHRAARKEKSPCHTGRRGNM